MLLIVFVLSQALLEPACSLQQKIIDALAASPPLEVKILVMYYMFYRIRVSQAERSDAVFLTLLFRDSKSNVCCR